MHINSKFWAACGLLLSSWTLPAHALNIFACEPEWGSLAQELVPDANIFSATTAYQDPHFVQARPSLIAKLRRADLFVCSGSELEIGWLPALQMRANNPNIRNGQAGAFYAAEQVERLDVLTQVDRTMGDVHGSGNPHVHFSPTRISTIADALAARLVEIEPGQKETIQANLAQFQTRWSQHISRLEQQAAPLRGLPVVAYHTSYRYLFDWLKIQQVGDLEPKPGLPPTSGHLASLMSLYQQTPYQLILFTDYQDGKGANWLADKVHLPVVQLVYSVDPDKPHQADLFALYQTVVQQLIEASHG